jgi:hypothetical protein
MALPCSSSRRLSPVPAGEVRRGDPPHNPFSAFSLPCEIRPISQGRPCSVSEQTRSVERKQGKGVVTGFPGGAPPSSLPRSAGEGSLQASPLAGKLLHDQSCVHPAQQNRRPISRPPVVYELLVRTSHDGGSGSLMVGWKALPPASHCLLSSPLGPSLPAAGEKGEESRVWRRRQSCRPQTPSFLPLPAPRSGSGEGTGGLTSVGFCHRGVNAWAEGRQGEVGRGSSPPQNPSFSPFPAL